MATAEEYAGWIVQNQDKKGTPEFETVAQAYKIARGAQPEQAAPPVMQNIPTMGESIAEELKTRAPGVAALAGVGSALDDAAYRLKQLFGNKLDPQETARVQANRDLTSASGQAMLGNIAGNIAMTGAPAAGLYRGATALAGRALPAALAPVIGGAVSGAAVSGATQPVLEGESTAGNMAIGAAGGAAGDIAARGAARLLHPITQSPAVQTLLRNNVVPTPGQATGVNSVWGRIEQRLQSVPVIGDIITGARNRATTEFNQAAINRAIPTGQAAAAAHVPGVGREAIARTDQILSQGYDDVLNRLGTVRGTPQFVQSVLTTLRDPDLALPANVQQRAIDIVQRQILDRTTNNQMSAQIAKRADANLGMLARQYSSSQDADQRMLARGIRAIQTAWRQNMVNGAPPDVAADLNQLNRAFANFVRVERAAGSSGAREGVFSPAQLQAAVRATDTSARRGNFAQGRALMQDLTDAGTSTLSQTVPNSGTVDRALLAALLGGGAAGVNEYAGGPGTLSALLLSPLLMSRAGSRYMVGDLAPAFQQGGANLIRQTAPYAANAGVTLAGLLNRQQ